MKNIAEMPACGLRPAHVLSARHKSAASRWVEPSRAKQVASWASCVLLFSFLRLAPVNRNTNRIKVRVCPPSCACACACASPMRYIYDRVFVCSPRCPVLATVALIISKFMFDAVNFNHVYWFYLKNFIENLHSCRWILLHLCGYTNYVAR